MNRPITTRMHGMTDYLMGPLLAVSPWLFGFAFGGPETIIPVILGVGMLLYSIFTDYETGLVRAIPMPMHLALDAGSGLFLAISPWLFGFSNMVYLPHVIFGLLEVGAALMTQLHPTHANVLQRA